MTTVIIRDDETGAERRLSEAEGWKLSMWDFQLIDSRHALTIVASDHSQTSNDLDSVNRH